MVVYRTSLLNNPNVGVYALTTNNYTLLPSATSEGKAKRLQECLKTRIVRTSMCGTRLLGIFAVANSNGVVLPYFTSDEEYTLLKSTLSVDVERLESKATAFGNLILANDKGGVASEILFREEGLIKKIEEVLDIELVQGEIAGLKNVGSSAVATNKGVLAHPMLKDEERKMLEDALKVRVDAGTVNGGCPYVSSGVLANDYGVIIGNFTTGTEALIISNILE